MLEKSSRYYSQETATLEVDGHIIRYQRRRFLPQPATQTTLFEYSAKESDRLDLLAATCFGDPLQAFRILDANAVRKPSDLLETRRRLRIALGKW
jgi:hypothetical protein